ncbi:50S ribosomal protein L24e [Halovenus halobia]|uniref:50S ribosomal protein L24e n=1 Tax=Halovenus halobia TaxID=3396622 RepID=UPI003F5597CC
MVQQRTCDYTGEDIEPGTGKMFVLKDGTVLWFKDSKAQKNYMMGRESRDLEWIGYEEADAEEADESEAEEAEQEADEEDEEADADEAEEADADESEDEVDADSEADEPEEEEAEA